jgi:two-component system NtrC family sensor kinase
MVPKRTGTRQAACRAEMRVRFSTRRRFVIAFAAVLAASISAPVYQLTALRSMEATFASLAEQERRMVLALELEDAVHDQYEHAARFVAGGGGDSAGYQAARERALHVTRLLTEQMAAAEAAVWERRIRDATAELGRVFHDRPEPREDGTPASAARVVHDPSYGVVLLIEESIHEYFGRMQAATSAFRQQLVALERSAVRRTALLLVAIPALVAAAVVYLSRSVSRPLARLSEGATAVAGGDLDTRIEIATPDEFGALAAKFNAMTAALKQHQARFVEAEKLAGIGRVAAGVAHELNNPLQVILGYLSLNRGLPDARLQGQLEAIEDEARRCKQIVDGMLELSRSAPCVACTVDLRALCDDVCGSLRLSAPPGACRLHVEGTGVAVVDRARLRQLVFNLVKNAVEASGPAGHVRVSVRANARTAEVAIADSGPGLAPEARMRLFEPFFTTKPSGTGLGLAVSRAIARTHGGDIEVANGSAGGAVFTLRLPRALEERIA